MAMGYYFCVDEGDEPGVGFDPSPESPIGWYRMRMLLVEDDKPLALFLQKGLHWERIQDSKGLGGRKTDGILAARLRLSCGILLLYRLACHVVPPPAEIGRDAETRDQSVDRQS